MADDVVAGDAGDEEPELTPTGQPIYRHKERTIPFQLARGDSANIERISEHVERHVGPVASVFHEIISDLVHIDVHVVKPTAARNYYTLVTSGMSDAPMTVPEGAEEWRFAELSIQLPPDWPIEKLGATAGRDKGTDDPRGRVATERWYWPIRWLKALARLPHEYDTWLGVGHTVPTGDPPVPYADDTELCCLIVLPPVAAPDEFGRLEVGPDKTIHFYSLVALYAEEIDLKLTRGTDALLERLARHDVGPVIDPRRANVASRKKWLGLF